MWNLGVVHLLFNEAQGARTPSTHSLPINSETFCRYGGSSGQGSRRGSLPPAHWRASRGTRDSPLRGDPSLQSSAGKGGQGREGGNLPSWASPRLMLLSVHIVSRALLMFVYIRSRWSSQTIHWQLRKGVCLELDYRSCLPIWSSMISNVL